MEPEGSKPNKLLTEFSNPFPPPQLISYECCIAVPAWCGKGLMNSTKTLAIP